MNRRDFLINAGATPLLLATTGLRNALGTHQPGSLSARVAIGAKQAMHESTSNSNPITVFLCGDVMTGRGIDQVLPHPSDPRIYEPYMRSALGYVELAERVTGPIPRPVDYAYIWGDALEILDQVAPQVRIINLETSVTRSNDYWQGKGINYRMHPQNIPCITAAKIDCCVLANNHVMDWGYTGLTETLETLKTANLATVGAGQNAAQAEAPAVMDVGASGRVVVFSMGSETSGIPWSWAASKDKPGVMLLKDLSIDTVRRFALRVREIKRPGDLVIASIHWGSNWGYRVPRQQTRFAHALIDEAAVDIVHGHSSHHAKGIEVYQGKPIIYGCGDFLNDYEGITGKEEFRDDLALMYFVTMNTATGKLMRLHMTPTQIKHFRINRASDRDAQWLRDTLHKEGKSLRTRVERQADNTLSLQWE